MQQPTVIIQCWSGPRNISTALMYSWRQRADVSVVDEPFYAFNMTLDTRGHPGADEVIASQSTDPDEVIEQVIFGEYPTPHLYVKQMAHHLVGVDRSHLAHTKNLLLTRDPREMLPSLSVQVPECTLADTGLTESVELLDAVLAEGGRPMVIDSQRLLADPAGVLGAVCAALGLEWDPAVLSWPAGPKPEDGVWAKHWYANVHRSTGFAERAPSNHPVPERLGPILDEAVPLYERLLEYAI
ncbi:MAG: sulfotransferase family protein [Actinomycetota bacterium]